MRVRCKDCWCWNVAKRRIVHRMAHVTNWQPPVGLDPGMREFKCSHCGSLVYKVLSEKELARLEGRYGTTSIAGNAGEVKGLPWDCPPDDVLSSERVS